MERRKFIKTSCTIVSAAVVPSLMANNIKPIESHKYTDMYFDMEFKRWLPVWFKNVACYALNSSGKNLIDSSNNHRNPIIIWPTVERSELVSSFCEIYEWTVKENTKYLDRIKVNIYKDPKTNKFQILGYAGPSAYDIDHERNKLSKVRSYISIGDIWSINDKIKGLK